MILSKNCVLHPAWGRRARRLWPRPRATAHRRATRRARDHRRKTRRPRLCGAAAPHERRSGPKPDPSAAI